MATILVEVLGNARQFKTEMASVAASTERAEGSFAKLGKAALLVGAAATGVAVVGLVKSVDAAEKFQASMELVQTQAGGSAKEVARMSKALVGLASSVGSTPQELSQGLYHVESAGFRGAKALSILKLAAEGAAVGHSDLEQTTTALVAAERTGIKGLGDMSHAMGTLNAIVGAGNMRMDDLTSALGTGVLVSAKAFGLSIQDVGSALATMTSNGIPAVNAASGLKMLFASLAAPTHQAAKLLATVGLSSTELATTMRTKGLGPALVELKAHMKDAGLNATQAAALLTGAFGKKSSTGLLTLLGNLGDLKKATDQVGAGAKNFGANWEETQKTAEFASKRFHAALSALEVQIGTALLPTVTRFTNWMTNELPVAVAGTEAAIAFLTPYFNDLKTVVGDVVTFVRAHWGEFSADVQAASDAIRGALTAVKPYFLDVVAVIGQVVSLVRAHWSEFEADFQKVKVVVSEVMTAIGPIVRRAWDDVKTIFEIAKAVITEVVRVTWEPIKTLVLGAMTAVKEVVTTTTQIIVGVIKAFDDVLHGEWGKAWGALKGVVSDALTGLTSLMRTILGTLATATGELAVNVVKEMARGARSALPTVLAVFSAMPGAIVNALGNVSSLLYNAGVSIIQGLYNGITSKVQDVYNLVGGIAGKISSLKGPIEVDRVLLIPHGQAIIEGLLLGLSTGLAGLPGTLSAGVQKALDAGRATIAAAQSSFQSAWSQIASDANTAFQGVTGAVQTPAEKTLAALQASGDKAGRQQALASANDALTQAQAGGDPAAILAAQQQLADALYAIRIAGLQKQAAAQRLQLDAQNTLQQRHFDGALAALQAHLAKGHDTYAEAHAAILKLFKSFGINYSNAGVDLGTAFVTGLKESIRGAAQGSGTLSGKLDSIANSIKIPHAATGGFVEQTGLAVIHQGETITPASQVGQGGNIYITGMIGDAQVEQLRNILIRTGRNTSGGVLGGF